jgi:hypothetical protein
VVCLHGAVSGSGFVRDAWGGEMGSGCIFVVGSDFVGLLLCASCARLVLSMVRGSEIWILRLAFWVSVVRRWERLLSLLE